MDYETAITILTKITSCFNLLLIVSSSILNPMLFYVCVRSKRLRTTSTFKLFAIGAINDFFANLPWNQECFTNSFFDLQLPYKNLFYCRWISVFFQFSCFEFTSWLLFSISLDRFLSMTLNKWTKHIFNGLKPVFFSICLAVIILAINFNQVFYGGYSFHINNLTEVIVCFDSPHDSFNWYHLMSQVYFIN